MVTGNNTENRNVRFEVGELVVGGKEITADMVNQSDGEKHDPVEIGGLELSGTYKSDKDDLVAKINEIIAAMREAGLCK